LRVDLFDFELPPERIALEPARPRDAARMLVVGADAALDDRRIADLPDFLRPGDALVVNDTRVIAARLNGVRARGDVTARIEATLIRRVDASRWRALVRPAKKLKVGERISFGEASDSNVCLVGALEATVEENNSGEVLLAFDFSGAVLDDSIEALGQMPLPPYIAARRAPGQSDRADYQTLFADQSGAVAAPTAGLHFTPELVARIEATGARIFRTTLHVGAGTFLPVKVEDTDEHRMHSEWGRVTPEVADALNETRARGGRIVAVGTTSLRILESAANSDGVIEPFSGETSIFITPGYRFRAVDVLLTNFHLPRSTLFMLVCAFAGLAPMRAAYAHAIAKGYRFYSYGDACLLFRPGDATRAALPLSSSQGSP
jgi:S-adenosylmethionine:tRNA ribosyltransferase-isomerase